MSDNRNMIEDALMRFLDKRLAAVEREIAELRQQIAENDLRLTRLHAEIAELRNWGSDG